MGGRVFIGRVVSNRMQKTVVVAVHYAVWVPKYKVYQKRISRHKAHDEDQSCVVGDIVRIQATRRLSKHKAYRVSDVISQAHVYSQDAAARIAQERSARPVPTVVEAAERKLGEAAARLSAVRRMFDQEIGAGTSISGINKT